MNPIVLTPNARWGTMRIGAFDYARVMGHQRNLVLGDGGPELKLLSDRLEGDVDIVTAQVVIGGGFRGHQFRSDDQIRIRRDGPMTAAGRSYYRLTVLL